MKINKLNNEAFTLIELIVVMAIIAVLVLLAAPRFLGYTKDANVTAMEQDTKVLADAAEMYHINTGEWPLSDKIEAHGMGGINELYRLDDTVIKSNVKNIKNDLRDYGIVTEGKYKGEVIHLSGVENSKGRLIHSPTMRELENYIAGDKDFSGEKNGEFQYVGEADIVYIPDKIKGVDVTIYDKMFEGTSVRKVISTNPNITSMSSMFRSSTAEELDLSDLNTKGVAEMGYMFMYSRAKRININGFDTSSVRQMNSMFNQAKVEDVDLSNLDTSNVHNMGHMFNLSTIKNINVSSFDTSKVQFMDRMFRGMDLESLDISHFKTDEVVSMVDMFARVTIQDLTLGDFTINDNAILSNMFELADIKNATVQSSATAEVLNNKELTNIPDDFYIKIIK